jgi:hypothetical protein
MADETEMIDIDKVKERLNKAIVYLEGIKPSKFGRADVKNFFVFLNLVEEYMKNKCVTSPRLNKAMEYFKIVDPANFNVATWFYVRHFAVLFKKYISGEDISHLYPVQLDTFELAKEIFPS